MAMNAGLIEVVVYKDENGTPFYCYYATADGGETWTVYDPETHGTPETIIKRQYMYQDEQYTVEKK